MRDLQLDGIWVSDCTATVEYDPNISPNIDSENYLQIFDHLRITYDPTSAILDFQGRIKNRPLRLVRKDADLVTGKVWGDLDKKDHLFTIHVVDANTSWVNIRNTDNREYFRRARPPKP